MSSLCSDTTPARKEAITVSPKPKTSELWLQKGMDSRSIVKSINESSEFRNHIENFQCRFLSRYGGTFSGVMKTLEESDFVIGSSQNVAVFNKYLSDLLGWGDVPRRIKNANRKSGRESILSEHGAFELIESLVAEDIKLHDYIDQECNTLYSNIDDPETVKSCLSVKRGYSKRVPGRVSKKINTYCKGYLGIDKQGYGSTGICIINNSDTALGGRRMPGLEIYYDLYDGKQQHLGTGKNTLKLPRPIPAGGFIELSFSIAVEEPIRHKVAYISVGLQNPGQLKFSDKQPLHNATAMIFNVDD